MYKGKSVLAVIPARSGSKGLPRKNIRPLSGKPLIAWTIGAALSSRYLDRVIVSTEDEAILLEGVEINLATRRVVSKGQEVRLTPKEFELLRYFVANPNAPISHTKLLQAVWGPDYGDQVEYLRVFVNQLRKKIEPDPAHPRYLLTEPWVGYRFSMTEKS